MVSRICEEFGCTPSVAVTEMEQDTGLLFDVLDLRAYARTKRAVDEDRADPESPMVDQVFAVVAELMRRRADGRERSRDPREGA